MKVYIDGVAGTTGLALEGRLQNLNVELLKLPESLRKDLNSRKKLLNEADVVFLCLPDEAAKEALSLITNPLTVVIDASTAHRTDPDWAYGFPELSKAHCETIKTANRIAVPGCHATGVIALAYPLIAGGFIHKDDVLACQSLTGYSGGGKAMIETYENAQQTAAKLYSMDLTHKHLPEIQAITGLTQPPIFTPVIVPTHQGMIVTLPLAQNAQELWEYLKGYYKNSGTIKVMPYGERTALEIENELNADELEIYVFGHEKQAVLAARLDNLGKGSSGAALQCMKVRMGIT